MSIRTIKFSCLLVMGCCFGHIKAHSTAGTGKNATMLYGDIYNIHLSNTLKLTDIDVRSLQAEQSKKSLVCEVLQFNIIDNSEIDDSP